MGSTIPPLQFPPLLLRLFPFCLDLISTASLLLRKGNKPNRLAKREGAGHHSPGTGRKAGATQEGGTAAWAGEEQSAAGRGDRRSRMLEKMQCAKRPTSPNPPPVNKKKLRAFGRRAGVGLRVGLRSCRASMTECMLSELSFLFMPLSASASAWVITSHPR